MMDCSWCGLGLPPTMEGVQVDHIIPVSLGGPNAPWNKQLLHTKCNAKKGNQLTPAAEKLARRRGVTLLNGRYRRRVAKPPSEIIALDRLMRQSPSWAELQDVINDVLKHADQPGTPKPGARWAAAEMRRRERRGQ